MWCSKGNIVIPINVNLFSSNVIVFFNVILINVSVSGWYTKMLQNIFPCNAMLSSNIILIDVYFVIIPET